MDEANLGSGAPEIAPVANAETFTQDDLQRIVKREKAEVAERVRRELETQHNAEIEKLRLGQTQSMGGMNQNAMDGVPPELADKIYKQVSSKFQQDMEAQQQKFAQDQHDAEMQRIAANYFSKMRAGKERYSDFDEMVGDFKHDAFPQLVYHLSGMDNAADLMYELNKNPEKLERIDYWLNKVPEKGLEMLHKLSQSIADVRSAEDEYHPTNPPLSQIKPTRNVGADSGNLGLEDLKQQDWLRF